MPYDHVSENLKGLGKLDVLMCITRVYVIMIQSALKFDDILSKKYRIMMELYFIKTIYYLAFANFVVLT